MTKTYPVRSGTLKMKYVNGKEIQEFDFVIAKGQEGMYAGRVVYVTRHLPAGVKQRSLCVAVPVDWNPERGNDTNYIPIDDSVQVLLARDAWMGFDYYYHNPSTNGT